MLSDSSGVTWFEPPPVEVITDSTATPTVNRNLTKGLEENLSWNFSLTADLTLITVTVAFKGLAAGSSFENVATFVQSLGKASLQDGFEDRFNVSWINSKITLTVFNVSAENNGEFECRLLLFDGSGTNTWKRNIQVIVLGKVRNYDINQYICIMVCTSWLIPISASKICMRCVTCKRW